MLKGGKQTKVGPAVLFLVSTWQLGVPACLLYNLLPQKPSCGPGQMHSITETQDRKGPRFWVSAGAADDGRREDTDARTIGGRDPGWGAQVSVPKDFTLTRLGSVTTGL